MMEKSYCNGIWNENIYITSKDFSKDIYFPLKTSKKEYIGEHDFESMKKIIQENHNLFNIIVDSRLTYLILVCELNIPNYILIYNIQNTEIESFNEFSYKEIFKFTKTLLYSDFKINLINCYLIINFLSENIQWKNSIINSLISKKNILEILINYLGWSNYHKSFDKLKSNKLIQIIKNKFQNYELLFNNTNELINSLIYLKNSQMTLDFN